MTAKAPTPIITPCVKVCMVDGQSGLCLGCYRTLQEIAGWSKLTAENRSEIMAGLPDRRQRISPVKLSMV